MDDKRNMVLFIALAALILFGWPLIANQFFPSAKQPSTRVEQGKVVANPQPQADPAADTPRALRSREVVLRDSPRVLIDTPRLKGSINLKGARIDDLVLTDYKETIDENSPPIRLFSPSGAPGAYFAGFGWTGQGLAAPGGDTVWTASAPVLRPGQPVVLSASSGSQRYQIRLTVDDGYMFAVQQSVANAGTGSVAVESYGYLSRAEKSKEADTWTIQIGPMWVANGAADYGINYEDVRSAPQTVSTTGGWAGFTDHYWLAALLPDQARQAQLRFAANGPAGYQADFRTQATILQPGQQTTYSARLFAGAKEVDLLDRYEDKEGAALFDKSIDWGWFEIIEKPIFYLLDWLFRAVGNFGLAIILLTFIVRGLMFPIAQKQFASMAGMRAVQPKMKVLQERYKDDKPRLQQEMMKLYKEEKVNPLAGCLPILIQIPIFFALYKVLLLTIEMRHQPFLAPWIEDLSAPDPWSPINLFGFLQFTPPSFLAIGVLPILVGITMWGQFKLNPQPMDEVQKQVFGIMPWMLMFVMAPFAAGLQLYWATTNILTIAQQKWLYSRHPALKEAPAK